MTDKKKSIVAKIKERVETSKDETSAPPWVQQVAMLTGILAAVSGFLAVRTTTLTNDAIYESNQAILAQTQSSDDWSEYQADSIKARIVETALTTGKNLTSAARADLQKQSDDLRDRQPAVKQSAATKATERDQHLQSGMKWLGEKDLLGYAGFAAQVGIALASVAALVRMRTPFVAGVAMGGIGIAITAYAFAVHYGIM